MNAADQYHVGILAGDFDATVRWFADTLGYRWCDEQRYDNVLVTADAEHAVTLRAIYSADAPHIEILEANEVISQFATHDGLHHLGYWSDDVEGDCSELRASGASLEVKGYTADHSTLLWAHLLTPGNTRIELIDRAVEPAMQRWWAAGRARYADDQ